MARSPVSKVIQHLREVGLRRDGAGLTDGELLGAFVARRDDACFDALVRRHGPMVLGVCRRLLRNPHDAEDAFQATWLVLARKAGSVVPREAVGNWLYGVALRTAQEARRLAARRRAREKQVKDLPHPAVWPEDVGQDWRPLLDQELNRLPDKYRVAVVLCDLEGRTRKDVAQQLNLPEGTVSGRLTTARRMLANRLSRCGLTLSGGALAVVLSQSAAAACVPTPLAASTVKAATLVAAGRAAATGAISAPVAALTEGVVRAMLRTKLKTTIAALLALTVFAAGVGVAAYGTSVAGEKKEARGADKPKAEKAKSDKDKLQGTWVAVSGEAGGKKAPDEFIQKCQVVIAGDKITLAGLVRGEKEKGVEGTFKLDPATKPKAIDIGLTNREDALGIYEVAGDTLKICLVEATGNERPTEFAGNDKQILIVLKRSKEK
jgi:RNA polymerase sigma factor (sigma-70 family)